jgi:hypothetical protein
MLYKKLARIGLPIVGQYIALTLQNIWHVDTEVNKIRKNISWNPSCFGMSSTLESTNHEVSARLIICTGAR